MKKRKLKGYVLPSIYGLVVITVFLTVYFLNNSLSYQTPTKDDKPVVNQTNNNKEDMIVVNPIPDSPLKPFIKENVEVTKSFYNQEDDVEKQKNSLIYYQNTYMQNSGVLYSSDESFEILASVDGTVKEVKEILGTVVTIEYNTTISTVYYSLSDVKVKAGDIVKANDIIGTSGSNKLENVKQNCLLFEVYKNGILIDPENFYTMSLEELK